MSMTNASTTFGAVRRPEVAHPRDEAARASGDSCLEVAVATARDMLHGVVSLISECIPSSTTDAMVSHSSNEAVA